MKIKQIEVRTLPNGKVTLRCRGLRDDGQAYDVSTLPVDRLSDSSLVENFVQRVVEIVVEAEEAPKKGDSDSKPPTIQRIKL